MTDTLYGVHNIIVLGLCLEKTLKLIKLSVLHSIVK